MSRELPILCAGPVVRAILEGRQTQDRRRVRINPYDGAFYFLDGWPHRSLDGWSNRIPGMEEPYRAPWSPGDVLYVRETWQLLRLGYDYESGWVDDVEVVDNIASDPRDSTLIRRPRYSVAYAADQKWGDEPGFPWRPSIHMPKWATRIRLRVLSVGVERVNAISHHDICAEGWAPRTDITNDPEVHRDAARDWWRDLWDGLYGAGSMDRGDWCWVTRFELVQ